jgi:nitrate reductase NapE component
MIVKYVGREVSENRNRCHCEVSIKVKTMQRLILALILFSTLSVAAMGQQQVYAWMLRIDLSEAGDFGDDRVCGSIRGQYGYSDYLCTDNGPSAEISFDIPDDKIPIGSDYTVCSWSNSLASNVFRDCTRFEHNTNGDVIVTQEDLYN